MSKSKVVNEEDLPESDPSGKTWKEFVSEYVAENYPNLVKFKTPFHMCCKTCKKFICKGTMFTAFKEDFKENDSLVNSKIDRLFIKCGMCLQAMYFRRNSHNTDYELESGAIFKETFEWASEEFFEPVTPITDDLDGLYLSYLSSKINI